MPPLSRRSFISHAAAAPVAAVSASANNLPRSVAQPGGAPRPYGSPADGESHIRRVISADGKIARSPLAAQRGMITPSGLFFTRTHAGIPNLDASTHRLLVHGAVEHPVFLKVGDLLRYPSVTRVAFIECAGNTSMEWNRPTGETVTDTHGLASCAEWTGVPLRCILDDVGAHLDARWFLAEGADAASYDRSIPRDLVDDDALIAYAENGEMLRPEQGYPMRLLLPGLSGSANVKWLSRIMLMHEPVYSREETARYSEMLPDGRVSMSTFELGPKSVITSPSGGMRLEGHGDYEIVGFAWSGAGAIRSVELSIDNGATWERVRLDEPILAKSFTRFTHRFSWTGQSLTLLSRAIDVTDARQPTRSELVGRRGAAPSYRYNAVHGWSLRSDGKVVRQWDI